MKKRAFIIISPGFAKDEEDSTCLPLQQSFVRSLNKIFPDLKVIILAFEYPFNKTTYQCHGNTVISFDGYNKGRTGKLLLWLSVTKTLNQLKKEYDIKGILSFWCTYCALVGKRFADRNSIKHRVWILGQDAKKENKYVKWIKPQSHELIALSDFAANEFFKNHHIFPQHIVPPGIETAQFLNEPTKRDIDILGVGSLIELKQYDVFVNIIFHLKKIFPHIKASICGKGVEEEKIKKLIVSLELENNLSLLHERSHTEVLQLMQQSKILLHPSSYEGFGVVCIEALFAGAHVISFCRPMNNPIPHWHIVSTKNEMLQKAIELLQNNTEHTSVIPFLIDDSTKKIMHLFDLTKKDEQLFSAKLTQQFC